MTRPLLIALPGNAQLAATLAPAIGADLGRIELRRFPDGESYIRLEDTPEGRPAVFLCSLDRPYDKVLPLLFGAATARDLGATSLGLIAPYLAYMRQDRRFNPGEAITSEHFARLLSATFDWLVTVDPHLHRRTSLTEIYTIPARALHAAPLLADWIRERVPQPLLIGPDSESDQWVAAVADSMDAPYVTLEKVRHGDRDVEVKVPEIKRWRTKTPVLIDDIISTGRTMIETLNHLARTQMPPAICVAIHGIFAGHAYEELLAAGAARVVTTNTVAHVSNEIDVTDLIARAMQQLSEVSGQVKTR